jgi:PIN domain nuclease of toxin-antitoxin system
VKVLIDTHVLLWMIDDEQKLSKAAMNCLIHPEAELYLSCVSVWEIIIKSSLGKLSLASPIDEYIARWVPHYEINVLPIRINDVLEIQKLHDVHRDPFDRLIVAQALVEKMPVITKDAIFDQYPISRIW